MTCTSVLVEEQESSKVILVAIFTLAARAFSLGAHAILQHAVQVGFAGQHVGDAAFETIPFRQIQFQSAEAVGEIESVHDTCRPGWRKHWL